MLTAPFAPTKLTTDHEIESIILETNLERPKLLLRPWFVSREAYINLKIVLCKLTRLNCTWYKYSSWHETRDRMKVNIRILLSGIKRLYVQWELTQALFCWYRNDACNLSEIGNAQRHDRYLKSIRMHVRMSGFISGSTYHITFVHELHYIISDSIYPDGYIPDIVSRTFCVQDFIILNCKRRVLVLIGWIKC